jgi:Pentapeptide repeats (8 copies)
MPLARFSCRTMLSFLMGILMKTFLDERLLSLKYDRYLALCRKRLASDQPRIARKGVSLLSELIKGYPERTQEILDLLCAFAKKTWNHQHPAGAAWNEVLVTTLRVLASVPKADRNGHPHFIELTELRLTDVELKGMNWANFVLWGTVFENVNMTRSSFVNTDLGGCVFRKGSSVEWSDFSGALMNFGLLNKTATFFDDTRLWGAKLAEARVDGLRLHVTDDFDASALVSQFGKRLVVSQAHGPSTTGPAAGASARVS